jgi:hypothetical protein
VFLIRSKKDVADKKVHRQHAGNALTRYELITGTWEDQTLYNDLFNEHPICAFI